MKMKIIGAIGTVTGSCTWCIHEETGTEFLVDCGMVQGIHQEFEMCQPFPFNPSRIKFVLLTHAHMDHCGMLPILCARGFVGKIFCTRVTTKLAKLQLKDCYSHVEKKLRQNIFGANFSDDKDMAQFVNSMPFNSFEDKADFVHAKRFPLSDDIFVTVYGSAHMLGAASFGLSWYKHDGDSKTIVFSGDVGCCNKDESSHLPFMRGNQSAHVQTDFFVCESTYGARENRSDEHKKFENRIEELSKIIFDKKYSTVILPCFAMQRAQDILMDLYFLFSQKKESSATIYVDSTMAKSFCEVFREELVSDRISKKGYPYLMNVTKAFANRFGGSDDKDIGICRDVIETVFRAGEWCDGVEMKFGSPKEDTDGKKQIIVTSSGMCQYGKVLSHLKRLCDENVALVLTGHQATSNGRNLKSLTDSKNPGKFKLALEGKDFLHSDEIKGEIFDMSPYYSGHADVAGLLDFLFCADIESPPPKSNATVFLNHGMNGARRKLRLAILSRSEENRKTDCRSIEHVKILHKNDPFFDLDERF